MSNELEPLARLRRYVADSRELGALLTQVREGAGLSKYRLRQLMGLGPMANSSVLRWERGTIRPSTANVEKIIAAIEGVAAGGIPPHAERKRKALARVDGAGAQIGE